MHGKTTTRNTMVLHEENNKKNSYSNWSLDVTYSDGSITEASLSPEIPLPTSTYTSSLDETCPSQVDILSQYQSQQSPVIQTYAIHNMTNSRNTTALGKIAMIFNKQPLCITKKFTFTSIKR